MTDPVMLYCTAPDPEVASTIAAALVDERLAACVNIHAPMTSVYRWKEKVETAAETPFLVKTSDGAVAAARDRILALHPYDAPCILAIDIDRDASLEAFVNWLGESTNS